MGLSEHEVAGRAGLTAERVQWFTELGIIRRREADGSYSEPDVLRARLALALEGSGVSPEDLGRGIAEGVVSLDFADYAMGAPIGLVRQSYDELASELGIERPTLERIRSAFGASRAPSDAPAREDDARCRRWWLRSSRLPPYCSSAADCCCVRMSACRRSTLASGWITF